MDLSPTPMKLLLIINLFAILLPYYCYGNSVVGGARDVELESQLRLLNKNTIKTIRTEVGDVFDCIDINKQPSLDHHLLKNHVIQTRPIPHSINTMVNDDHHDAVVSSSSSSPYSSSVKHSSKIAILRKLDCPDGTVPIHRTSKKDLNKANSFSKLQQLLSSINNVGDQHDDDLENPDQGQFLSIAKTRKDSGIEYSGIQAVINIYNPSVTENQVSTSQLWIENGTPKEELNSLQAGWIVAPSLFGDNKTRLFGKWQVDSSNKSEGCYNIICQGFIQIDKNYPLGGEIVTISQYGGAVQFDTKVAISKDGSGNWWLEVEDIKIGYWPFELEFSQLTQGSSVIAWGGLAARLGATKTTVPPTGNGNYPIDSTFFIDFRRQCYMRKMKVIPAKNIYWEDPTRKIINTFATNRKCSFIRYFGQLDRKNLQHTLVFGGPGGNCSQF